jgi:predicted 3-demethylubiquinone-9 3-methyltransferase (glyoxalase superfamily)
MQKITPFLWFDKNCEEAINFYTTLFPNSEVTSINRYPEGPLEPPMAGMEGKVLTAVFQLAGQKFMALDGGPHLKFNPSVSFFVTLPTEQEVDDLYNKLNEGATILMPLQKYEFAEKYVWLQDKYGLPWQIMLGQNEQTIIPSYMLVGENFGKAEEALNFYTGIFKNSKIDVISHYDAGTPDEGKINYALFTLEGQKFTLMESGMDHKFETTAAISEYIECEGQEEVDYYWDKLSEGADPSHQQCGWVQDKYGFSWQVIPTALPRLLSNPDKAKSGRAMQAMLQMKKIIVADLEAAANAK